MIANGIATAAAVTIAEVEDGIAKLRREKATRRSKDLARWLDAVLHLYSDRILTFDTPTARLGGRLLPPKFRCAARQAHCTFSRSQDPHMNERDGIRHGHRYARAVLQNLSIDRDRIVE